jgi:hypothetical protein
VEMQRAWKKMALDDSEAAMVVASETTLVE